ncbi:unnamed protein product [Orchesella dallaii]|uniref:Uncharacterized protein n=1 Tax=Orchesella dallaii TaxID=48710 RepID=A0ABP1QNP2_9HEXA
MCPFRVSTGQMRGTSSSSRTLFKATHTTATPTSCVYTPREGRLSLSFRWGLFVAVVILLVNIYACDGKQIPKRTGDINTSKRNSHSRSPATIQEHRSNEAVKQEDSDSNINHDTDQIIVDEKVEDVKTVRFGNHKKNPYDDSSSGKRKGNHRNSHHSSKSKSISNSADEDDDDKKNEIQTRRNHRKQGRNGNQDSSSSNNADSATFELEEARIPSEPVRKGDGLDSRELKHFIEDVAESILAEADRLYGVIESGSGVGFRDATSTLQLSSSFDVGNYIICQ